MFGRLLLVGLLKIGNRLFLFCVGLCSVGVYYSGLCGDVSV